jgi:hypothetical protein
MPTLKKPPHKCRPVLQLSISADEAALIAALLRPRAHLLTELLEVQVQHSPPGCTDWADTADALAVANSALVKVRNAQVRHQQEVQG